MRGHTVRDCDMQGLHSPTYEQVLDDTTMTRVSQSTKQRYIAMVMSTYSRNIPTPGTNGTISRKKN